MKKFIISILIVFLSVRGYAQHNKKSIDTLIYISNRYYESPINPGIMQEVYDTIMVKRTVIKERTKLKLIQKKRKK